MGKRRIKTKTSWKIYRNKKKIRKEKKGIKRINVEKKEKWGKNHQPVPHSLTFVVDWFELAASAVHPPSVRFTCFSLHRKHFRCESLWLAEVWLSQVRLKVTIIKSFMNKQSEDDGRLAESDLRSSRLENQPTEIWVRSTWTSADHKKPDEL